MLVYYVYIDMQTTTGVHNMNTATYTVTLIDTDTSDTIKTLSFDSISKLANAIRSNTPSLRYSYDAFSQGGWYTGNGTDYFIDSISNASQLRLYFNLIA